LLVKHLMTYSSKYKYYTEPVLQMLFRKDMENRIKGPQVEDLSIDTDFTTEILNVPFLGSRGIAKKHKQLKMPFKLIPNCSRFSLNTTKFD